MIEKGTVLEVAADTPETYLVVERIEKVGRNEKGWLCLYMNAIIEKGIENISKYDYWRVTDSYLKMQIARGVIKVINK